MADRLEPATQHQLSFDEAVAGGLSPSGIGDTKNNFHRIRVRLEIPEFWSKVRRAQTYNEYVQEKYQNNSAIGEAVVEGSDPSYVATYNAFAQRVNETIGKGVKSEEQVAAIELVLIEVDTFIRGYSKNLAEAKRFVGPKGIPDDSVSNFALFIGIDDREFWKKIGPVPSYEEYCRTSALFADKPAVAEAVIYVSNKGRVARFNKAVSDINEIIGSGVTTQEQVDKIKAFRDEVNNIIYGE